MGFSITLITTNTSPKVDFIYGHFTDGATMCREEDRLLQAKAELTRASQPLPGVPRPGVAHAKSVFSSF